MNDCEYIVAFSLKSLSPILLSLAVLFSRCGFAQTYSIDWHKIAGGGEPVGGPLSGPLSGTNYYAVTGGFWVLPQAVQAAGAPTLSIVPAAPGYATVSWTPLVLQENLNLGTTNWVDSPSAASNPVTVPAGAPRKFYRLYKP